MEPAATSVMRKCLFGYKIPWFSIQLIGFPTRAWMTIHNIRSLDPSDPYTYDKIMGRTLILGPGYQLVVERIIPLQRIPIPEPWPAWRCAKCCQCFISLGIQSPSENGNGT